MDKSNPTRKQRALRVEKAIDNLQEALSQIGFRTGSPMHKAMRKLQSAINLMQETLWMWV